jgi:hypothetical protein
MSGWWAIAVAMLLGSGCGALKLVQRYRRRWEYAVRHRLGWVLIGVPGLFSCLIYGCCQLTTFRLGLSGVPALNSILQAVCSAFVGVGVLTTIPFPLCDRSGVHIFMTASVWITEILEKEIDVLVTQDVVETVLDIERKGVSFEIVQKVGNLVIQSAPISRRSVQLARLDGFARDRNVAGLVYFLMDYCSLEWLAAMTKRHAPRSVLPNNGISLAHPDSPLRKPPEGQIGLGA